MQFLLMLVFQRASCLWPSCLPRAESPSKGREKEISGMTNNIYNGFLANANELKDHQMNFHWLFLQDQPSYWEAVSIIFLQASELARGLEYNLGYSQMGFALRPTLQSHSLAIIFHSIINIKRQMKGKKYVGWKILILAYLG